MLFPTPGASFPFAAEVRTETTWFGLKHTVPDGASSAEKSLQTLREDTGAQPGRQQSLQNPTLPKEPVSARPGGGREGSTQAHPHPKAAQPLRGADNILGLRPPPASHGNGERGHPAGVRNLCREKQRERRLQKHHERATPSQRGNGKDRLLPSRSLHHSHPWLPTEGTPAGAMTAQQR